MDPIARAILIEMQQRKLSISEVARRTGVDRTGLGRWLAGERSPRLRDVYAVAIYMGIRITAEPERHHGEHTHASTGHHAATHRLIKADRLDHARPRESPPA